MSPFTFLGLPFFHQKSFDEPLCVFGLPIFSSEVFVMRPFIFFGLPLFSLEVFFNEPMNEGS
jgi:hypothetical protein